MGIRKKILFYFSLTIISLAGIALFFIYTLFAENREEEFQQRQKEKIKSTLYLLSEIKKADQEVTEAIDRININDLYDEKLLIFNNNKELIYSSIDDTPVQYSKVILDILSPDNEWYESKDELYDVVGLYFENKNKIYYGISKAFDKFGYSKLNYLKWILISTFLIISIAVVFISYFLSKKITQPLISITKQISNYNFENEYKPIHYIDSKDEIAILAQQFNKLMKRMNSVFSFQKHAIHHISHELKTPISILVSNFERIENESDSTRLKALIVNQKEDTKALSEIINVLLASTKAESGTELINEKIRIDELIFDVADELNKLHPQFQFAIEYNQTEHEHQLIITGNSQLLRSAITNIMLNCIQYSATPKANITIGITNNQLIIQFKNNGNTISEDEIPFLFQHFFRGNNSCGKRGFGLGLVFVKKIIGMHNGSVNYYSPDTNTNIFSLAIPLS